MRGSELRRDLFRITDSDYGTTGALWKCQDCGFLEAAELKEVLQYYNEMVDPEYEATSTVRAIQFKQLLRHCIDWFPPPIGILGLLDVGSGTGILLKEALNMGLNSEGVEPSKSLCELAKYKGLSVHHGTIPHPEIRRRFDIITLVDVIEHVSNPVELLGEINRLLKPGGILLLVTPDIHSLVARVMRNQWWHYRVAHIGYFQKATLKLALNRAGFEITKCFRPLWHLPAGYLLERLRKYCPFLPAHLPNSIASCAVPLNMFDSMAVLATPRKVG